MDEWLPSEPTLHVGGNAQRSETTQLLRAWSKAIRARFSKLDGFFATPSSSDSRDDDTTREVRDDAKPSFSQVALKPKSVTRRPASRVELMTSMPSPFLSERNAICYWMPEVPSQLKDPVWLRAGQFEPMRMAVFRCLERRLRDRPTLGSE
jgi:hypothetical protein